MDLSVIVGIITFVLGVICIPIGKRLWNVKRSQDRLKADLRKIQERIDKDLVHFIKDYIIEMPHRTDEEKEEIIEKTVEILEEIKLDIERVLLAHGETEIRRTDPTSYQRITKFRTNIDQALLSLGNKTEKPNTRYQLIYKTKNKDKKSNPLLSLYQDQKIVE